MAHAALTAVDRGTSGADGVPNTTRRRAARSHAQRYSGRSGHGRSSNSDRPPRTSRRVKNPEGNARRIRAGGAKDGPAPKARAIVHADPTPRRATSNGPE